MLMVGTELFAEMLMYLDPEMLVSLDHTAVKVFKGLDRILKLKPQNHWNVKRLDFLLTKVGCIKTHQVKIQ